MDLSEFRPCLGTAASLGDEHREHDEDHGDDGHDRRDQERAGGGRWRLIGCGCFPLRLGHFMSATSQLLQLHLYEHQCEDDGEKDGIKKTSTGDRSTENNGI